MGLHLNDSRISTAKRASASIFTHTDKRRVQRERPQCRTEGDLYPFKIRSRRLWRVDKIYIQREKKLHLVCYRDSGGPLVRDGILVGIVSYGTAVCAVSMPDVYTRASVYAGKSSHWNYCESRFIREFSFQIGLLNIHRDKLWHENWFLGCWWWNQLLVFLKLGECL